MTTPSDGYTDLPAGKLASVVTSLEMLEPPASRPAPPHVLWSLRRVERPGTGWYRELFRRVGEPYLWFSRLDIGDEALRAILHDPRVEVYALQLDGSDEGLLELDFRQDGECEIAFFGLTQRTIGTGAGRWLMNRAIEIAWAHPIRRFWLHTCTSDHPSAVPFYMRSGFRPFKRQIEIVDDPRLNGIIPRDAAPQIPLI
ncbi:MAG: GNAT family N-acetyltransferase [Vulcanimicrobiaceae bacterium]